MRSQRQIPWLLLGVTAAVSAASGTFVTSWWRLRPRQVIDAYHIWFHRNGEATYNNTRWLGVTVQKCPLDLWIFQEILAEVKPDVLVEAGTYRGGSAYYFASVFDLAGRGRVLTVDIEDFPGKPRHDRITYLLGSSTSEEIASKIRASIRDGEKVMVVLDSDHHKDHVLNELRTYSPLVSPGSYLIVEDTHFNGNPILPKFGPGPMEAVREFLQSHPGFQPDTSREKYGMTFNRSGYLKRLR